MTYSEKRLTYLEFHKIGSLNTYPVYEALLRGGLAKHASLYVCDVANRVQVLQGWFATAMHILTLFENSYSKMFF